MNSFHLYWNLKGLTPFLPNDFHQGKKKKKSKFHLFYFIPEVLRYKQIGEKNNHI